MKMKMKIFIEDELPGSDAINYELTGPAHLTEQIQLPKGPLFESTSKEAAEAKLQEFARNLGQELTRIVCSSKGKASLSIATVPPAVRR